MKIYLLTLLTLLSVLPIIAQAAPLKLTWGGYIDTQYTYDSNTPAEADQAYSSQPARANEFNLNLGHLDVNISSDKIRGRFALQVGTAVQSNYDSEPERGDVSGPELARHIQEARVGYKINDKTWIDAGVFYAHFGAEFWVPQKNLNLTQSFLGTYAPDYLSGIKLVHEPSDNLKLQLLVTNGWQIMAEDNTDKNIGTGIEYSLDHVKFVYNTMLGREVSPELNGLERDAEFRHFHNFVIQSKDTKILEWVLQFDTGFQNKPDDSGQSQWYGAAVMARVQIAKDQKISLRLEHFVDDDQIVLVTDQPDGFNGFGGSIGFDQTLEESDTHQLQWRTEVKLMKADADVFPKNVIDAADTSVTATTSMALSF